jgi:hypothetical protein
MTRIAQRHAGGHVAKLRPFTGHGSLRGEFDYDRRYVVYSYATPILAVDLDHKIVIVNRCKYSVTTSKQQTYTFSGVASLARDGYTIVNVEHHYDLADKLRNLSAARVA